MFPFVANVNCYVSHKIRSSIIDFNFISSCRFGFGGFRIIRPGDDNRKFSYNRTKDVLAHFTASKRVNYSSSETRKYSTIVSRYLEISEAEDIIEDILE